VSISDPVGDGFVATLAKPGGNATGFSNYDPAMVGKWLELLGGSRYGRKHISITAVIRSRRRPGATRFLRSTQIDWLWNQVT